MSITFDIPPDIAAGVAGIADLDLRVALFLKHEAQMESLRRQRHSPQARTIVADAIRQAEADQAAGLDWDASFAELRRLHATIAAPE